MPALTRRKRSRTNTPRIAGGILFFVAVLSGCASTITTIDKLGISQGDSFVLEQEASLYLCDTWETTGAIWSGAPPETLCLKASVDVSSRDDVLGTAPAGTKVAVRKITRLNLFERVEYLVYVQASDWPEIAVIREYYFGALRKPRE